MRCNQCQYPLWNLTTRVCPECGKSFAPSEYQFIPNSVRFCCPRCDQAYYGTNQLGHLTPSAFECVTCHASVTMDEMVLRPVQGQEDKTYAVIEPLPWLQRRSANWFSCWWKTIWRGMVTPMRLMRGLPADAHPGEAWWFATITLLIASVIGIGLPFGIITVFGMIGGGGGGTVGTMVVGLALPVILLAVTLLYIVIWGLTTHWTLLLTGGAERGLGDTFQTLCYSAGPNALMAVPCLGPYCLGYVSSVWWVVSAILMLMTLQQIHGGRATLAVLVWPVITMLVVGVLYFGLIFGGMFMGGMGGAFAVQSQATSHQMDADSMAQGLRNYAAAHGGWPEHAAQLIDDQAITSWSFAAASTDTYTDTIPLGDGTLDEFDATDQGRRQKMMDDAVAAQPDDVIAHRVGDYVFMYHGVDPSWSDWRLWLFVMIEDPDANISAGPLDPIFVAPASGSAYSINRASLPWQIAQQNDVRAEHGLPPLPANLLDVTHGAPARESE